MRHVFRRHGVFELGLRYTLGGEVFLKERGRQERPIDGVEASRATRYINDLLGIVPEEPRTIRTSHLKRKSMFARKHS